jgi:hypothetical protein
MYLIQNVGLFDLIVSSLGFTAQLELEYNTDLPKLIFWLGDLINLKSSENVLYFICMRLITHTYNQFKLATSE